MKPWLHAFLTLSFIAASALAQDAVENPYPVTECKSVAEVQQARQRGAILIKTGERYFVRIGTEYKGPYASLETAVNERKAYEQKAQDAGIILPRPSEDSGMGEVYHNPEAILFPFVDVDPQLGMTLALPDGSTARAVEVMIHPEPFLFDAISFGRIRLEPPRPPMAPGVQRPTPAPAQQKNYFAVTGSLAAKPAIRQATQGLSFSVGAAVIAGDGEILWRQYGSTGDDLSFKIVAPIQPTRRVPVFLLVFSLAQGRINQTLRTSERYPVEDTSGYDYHVLCSAALEMGPNWFPPLDEAIREEFNALKREEQAERGR